VIAGDGTAACVGDVFKFKVEGSLFVAGASGLEQNLKIMSKLSLRLEQNGTLYYFHKVELVIRCGRRLILMVLLEA
jgi:hypothetical protein